MAMDTRPEMSALVSLDQNWHHWSCVQGLWESGFTLVEPSTTDRIGLHYPELAALVSRPELKALVSNNPEQASIGWQNLPSFPA